MSTETTDAIVLRTVDFMESSLILTVYTRKLGKVHGIAKGAKRLKNAFETSLDLLASIKLTFIRKNSDALDLFTEAKLARRFRPTARNQRGLYAGYYVAELLNYMTVDYDPAPELWRLADLTLESLATRDRVGSRVFAYEAWLLDAVGEFPSTRHCVECGQELPLDRVENLERRIWFENNMGGVVCKYCMAKRQFPGLVPTTIGALKALEASLEAAQRSLLYAEGFESRLRAQYDRVRDLTATDRAEIEDNAAIVRESLDRETFATLEEFDPGALVALRELLNRYFARIMQRRLRSLDYLGFATRGESFPDAAAAAQPLQRS